MDSLFFYISKFAWALLSPLNVVIILVCFASVLLLLNYVRLTKWLLSLLLIVNLPILVYPVGDLLIYPLESRFQKPAIMPNDIDGIIVLGGAESLTTTISWQQAEVTDAADRYIYAAKLAKQYQKAPVIYTGGSGSIQFRDDNTSAQIPMTVLTASGVKAERLIIESASRNTAQNFSLIKPLLPNPTGQYLLITSAFHMPRSVGIARQNGINVIPYPVDYKSNKAYLRKWSIDYLGHMKTLSTAWKEWIGLTVYFFTGKTSSWFPKP